MAVIHTARVAAKRKQEKKSSNWFELEGGFLFTTTQVTVNTVIGTSVMSWKVQWNYNYTINKIDRVVINFVHQPSKECFLLFFFDKPDSSRGQTKLTLHFIFSLKHEKYLYEDRPCSWTGYPG